MTEHVDGTWSLEDQQNTLNFYQQQQNAKLTSYSKKSGVVPRNVATFEPVPLGTNVPDLTLVVVPSGQQAAGAQPVNTTLTSDASAYVESDVRRVAAFHDNAAE